MRYFSHLIISDEALFHTDEYVNKQNYRFWSVLIEHRLNMHDFWLEQDGATAHTSRETMTILRAAFPWSFNFTLWSLFMPPLSPDLTSPDSLFWGYLKGKVYLNVMPIY